MPSEFRENAEDLNTGEPVQVDVNAIRARLDAATPGPWIYEPSEALHGISDACLHYVSDPVAVADDDPPLCSFYSKADAEMVAAAPTDLRRLLDENARLNAENERIRAMTKLHRESVARQRHKLEQKLIGWREAAEKAHAELDKVIRETAADKARLAAVRVEPPELAAIRERVDRDFVTDPGSVSGELAAELMQARIDRRALLVNFDAELAEHAKPAPEMPRPPAEEEVWSDADRVCASDGCGESCRHDEENPVPPAQKPVSGPETAGTGSGRGTGVTEAPESAQVADDE